MSSLPPDAVIVWDGGEGLTSFGGAGLGGPNGTHHLAQPERRAPRKTGPVALVARVHQVYAERTCICGCGRTFIPARKDRWCFDHACRQRAWKAEHMEQHRKNQREWFRAYRRRIALAKAS